MSGSRSRRLHLDSLREGLARSQEEAGRRQGSVLQGAGVSIAGGRGQYCRGQGSVLQEAGVSIAGGRGQHCITQEAGVSTEGLELNIYLQQCTLMQ